jgi:hypothetical protein
VLAGRRGASSAFVVRGDLVHRVKLVVDDGVDCLRGSRWQALEAWLSRALGELGRSACLVHTLPRRLSRAPAQGGYPASGEVPGAARHRPKGGGRRGPGPKAFRKAKRPEGQMCK